MKMYIKPLGRTVEVTFPTSSYQYGAIKFNGVKVGTWVKNCEGLWHGKASIEGRDYHSWSKGYYGKQGMKDTFAKVMEKGLSIW